MSGVRAAKRVPVRWVLPFVVLAVLLAACGDGESGDAPRDAGSTLSPPSPGEAAERATPEHDGYAVIGCEYVLHLYSVTAAPFADLRVTLATLEQSTTLDAEVRSAIELAYTIETMRDLPTVVHQLRRWCEDEGLISPGQGP